VAQWPHRAGCRAKSLCPVREGNHGEPQGLLSNWHVLGRGEGAAMKDKRMCANGCPSPVKPTVNGNEFCICQECVDKITRTLEGMLEGAKGKKVRR
jgi:hypothetical protein